MLLSFADEQKESPKFKNIIVVMFVTVMFGGGGRDKK